MELTNRQKQIVDIVKEAGAIKGEEIAEKLGITRSALRTDFSILIKTGIILSKQKVGYTYNNEFKKENNKNYVRDIMGPPIFIDESYSVYRTVLLMFEKDIGTIFVTKDGSLSGIVSRKDLLRTAIGKRDIEQIPINLIMTRMPNIIYTTEDEKISECVRKIIDHQIDSLPVIRPRYEEGREILEIVGRLTKTNMSKLLLELLENGEER